MADEQDLSVPTPDAGMAFRMEMWASNAILGYWWVLAIGVAVILAGVAIYGIYDNVVTDGQRSTSEETANVLRRVKASVLDAERMDEAEMVPTPDGGSFRLLELVVTPSFSGLEAPARTKIPLGLAIQQFAKEDADVPAELTKAGDELMALAANGSGPAGHQAALMAAEMYRLAEDSEAEGKALEVARTSSVPAQRYAAEARIAWRAVAQGDAETMEATLRPWFDKKNDAFGQQAAYDIGRAYEALDRPNDAEAAYRGLLNTWSVTPYRDAVNARLEDMGLDAVPMDETPSEGEGEAQPAGETETETETEPETEPEGAGAEAPE